MSSDRIRRSLAYGQLDNLIRTAGRKKKGRETEKISNQSHIECKQSNPKQNESKTIESQA